MKTEVIESLTPSKRFEALCYYLGWQGGTVHQLEAEIGCPEALKIDLALTSIGLNTYDSYGFTAVRTCELSHRNTILLPKYKGNWAFWSGVIRGYWVTGALGGAEFSKRFGN